MIRTPLGLRLDASRPIREQIRAAARLGAKGVVLDAVGDLSPDRLSETGRRELRHALRSVELTLIALHLPTRRPFDSIDGLDDRLARAERAFGLAYELGTPLVLARLGPLPGEADAPRREAYLTAARELGRRADHRGARLAIETGTEPASALRAVLEGLGMPSLAASLDPSVLLSSGFDPAVEAQGLFGWVAHAYAGPAASLSSGPRPVAFDWAEYLGALEEIDYRGFLTVAPGPSGDPESQFLAIKGHLARF